MSTSDDFVRYDYGLSDHQIVGRGKERRIWETTFVTADPHFENHFYVVQKLAGEWKRRGTESGDEVVWMSRGHELPPVTRVLYCTMDGLGRMINLRNGEEHIGRVSEPRSE